MTPDIRELDEATRNRIAAGEVVERPASVVKELVENALDADASRIAVGVEGGGTDRIVVSDDGVGMSEAAVRRAVREHTTSKLRDVSDLEAIGTLGFRGEALHAIGSVARLAIRTRPRGGDRGTELVVEGGEVVVCDPVGCPEGTTVEVTDLFGTVPARRKYLKTESTEFAHVQRVAAGYALARPDVAVALERDGRETFATTGDGDRRSAVMAVYGRAVAESMIDVGATFRTDATGGTDGEAERDSGATPIDADGPLVGVEGLVSHPETNRAGREYVTTLVDGRYVDAGVVREAVVDAYGTQLAPDRYPFAVVDVAVPPGGVDVNVHPRKLEVLFADDEGVRRQVRAAVRSALLEAGLLRSRAPRGRSAAEQTEIDAGTSGGRRSSPADGAVEADPDRSSGSAAETPSARRQAAADASTDDTGDATADDASTPDHDDADASPADASPADASPADADRADDTDRPAGTRSAPPGRSFRTRPVQRTVDREAASVAPGDPLHLPPMEVLGQFDDTYLVAETDDGLVLVDQHAADERVHYERLRGELAGDVTTQALAEPVDLELTAREASLLADHADALARLGFRTDRPDDETARVRTVPALVAERAGESAPALARDLIETFVEGDPEGAVEAVVDDLLADLACYPAVTGGSSLQEGAVAELLVALDDCENPWACPHGRPTVIELAREEIEARFERDYPGHGGRRD